MFGFETKLMIMCYQVSASKTLRMQISNNFDAAVTMATGL